MHPRVHPHAQAFRMSHFALGLQLSDVDEDTARVRARGGTGASISWIVGHLLGSRCTVLRLCGVEVPNPWEERFSMATPATDGSDYPTLAELRSAWEETHERLQEALDGMDGADLEKDGGFPTPLGDSRVASALTFFAFHESYHLGAIGNLRVEVGLRHTHEKALEAMEGAD